jgi:hypothetical protein
MSCLASSAEAARTRLARTQRRRPLHSQPTACRIIVGATAAALFQR